MYPSPSRYHQRGLVWGYLEERHHEMRSECVEAPLTIGVQPQSTRSNPTPVRVGIHVHIIGSSENAQRKCGDNQPRFRQHPEGEAVVLTKYQCGMVRALTYSIHGALCLAGVGEGAKLRIMADRLR